MSAIAEFRLIPVSKFPNLLEAAEIKIKKGFFTKKTIDNFPAVLAQETKKLIEFDWSGYTLADLLIFLQERKNINLLEGEYDVIANQIAEKGQTPIIIFTYEHKLKYASLLTPQNFPVHELIEFNKEFSESNDPELGTAQLDGIAVLKLSLDSITSRDFAVLLFIG